MFGAFMEKDYLCPQIITITQLRMKKILLIVCCMMVSLSISAQKNFVYGIYNVRTLGSVGGSYIIDMKNKKFLPDCDGGEYEDCGDIKNIKQVGDETIFDWYNKGGTFGGRGKLGKTKEGRRTFAIIYGKGTKFGDAFVIGTEKEQHAYEEQSRGRLGKVGALGKGVNAVKGLFQKKDKTDNKNTKPANKNTKPSSKKSKSSSEEMVGPEK